MGRAAYRRRCYGRRGQGQLPPPLSMRGLDADKQTYESVCDTFLSVFPLTTRVKYAIEVPVRVLKSLF